MEQKYYLRDWLFFNKNSDHYRATGRTYRIANNIIDDFFNKPMGSKITIVDHYPERRADMLLADLVARRLDHDFPEVKFKVDTTKKTITIERLSPTYNEQMENYKHKKLLKYQWTKMDKEQKKQLCQWAEKLIAAHDNRNYLSYAEDGLALTTNINEWADNAASCLYQMSELLK